MAEMIEEDDVALLMTACEEGNTDLAEKGGMGSNGTIDRDE